MKKLCLLPLVLAFAATAQAETRSARLLGDAPQLMLGATPRLLDSVERLPPHGQQHGHGRHGPPAPLSVVVMRH